jgi:ABC-2 type transport system ATP-binding protein
MNPGAAAANPPPVPPGPAVQTFGLTRAYGTMTALDRLDLTVQRGDLFGFIGSNGAGKTTTLRILATFLTPSAGTARIFEKDVVTEADQVRHLIGYMPDFFGVYKDMEVTEYLDFFGACYRIPAERRERTVADVLELVGLTGKRGSVIGALSRGMQQRLGLARVLIHDPQLLLLDEPASGLDPRARIEMMAILQELRRMGKTIIISSHILSELQALCNRCAIIERGRLIYSGPVQGAGGPASAGPVYLVRSHSEPETVARCLQGAEGILEATPLERQVRVVLASPDADPSVIARTLVNAGLGVLELKPEEVGLEEVFLRVTRGETQ